MWSPALLRGCQPLYTQVYPGFCLTLPFPNKPDTGAQSGFTTTGMESYYLPNDCFVSAPFVTAPFVTAPFVTDPVRYRPRITCCFVADSSLPAASLPNRLVADERLWRKQTPYQGCRIRRCPGVSAKWGEVATAG